MDVGKMKCCWSSEEQNVEHVAILGANKEIQAEDAFAADEPMAQQSNQSPRAEPVLSAGNPEAEPEPPAPEVALASEASKRSSIGGAPGDTPEPGSDFVIDITKPNGAGSDLGCSVFFAGHWVPLIILATPNAGPLAGKVQKYDRIVDVNGVTGSFDVMAKAIKEASSLHMTMRKPKFYTIEIIKTEGSQLIGLEFVFPTKLDDEFLVIQGISKGQIVDHLNAEYADRAVRLYDCVVDVNGIKGCKAMITEIGKCESMILTLYRHFKATEIQSKV